MTLCHQSNIDTKEAEDLEQLVGGRKRLKVSRQNIGSGIDKFLREDGIFEDSQAQAIKELVAYHLDVNAPSLRPGKRVV